MSTLTTIHGAAVPTDSMHKAILGAFPQNAQGNKELYDEWSKTIDKEYTIIGYNGPRAGVETLERWLPNKEAIVMDIACGTGLVGEQLAQKGYTSFDGVDISPGSIKISEEKQIYRRLICDEVCSRHKMDVSDDTYDAILCVGCFIPGHLSQDIFPELLRIVKGGGLIIIAMREEFLHKAPEYNDGKLEMAIQQLVHDGIWQVLARDTIDNFFGKHDGVIFVLQTV